MVFINGGLEGIMDDVNFSIFGLVFVSVDCVVLDVFGVVFI